MAQLEFPIDQPYQPDRNAAAGGRSFYFFDFDDNVVFLKTPLYVFHRDTGAERQLTTKEFALLHQSLGQPDGGEWADFEVRIDPQLGSYRRFRELEFSFIQKHILMKKQPFVEDVLEVIVDPGHSWRGPSWNFFWHAVHHGRPLSVITARGHHPDTIKKGILAMKKAGHLTKLPNYLSLYPVSHGPTRQMLGDRDGTWHTAHLKKEAIKASVEQAFQTYGFNSAHRFGMSDDDPKNIALIIEAMKELKGRFPKNSFFVINTHGGGLLKQEVFVDHVEEKSVTLQHQLKLF